ncbi:MAG: Na+/H+ antiporter [Streptosporangiales bacterium]|nr:Na+/H+ antiporter [Streptosporangiales bacterium]
MSLVQSAAQEGHEVLLTAMLAVLLIGVGVIAVTAIAQRIGVSAPLLLIAVALGVSLLPWVPAFQVNPDVVLFVLLPPLLYAASMNSSLIGIRRSRRPIGLLAVGLVIVTALTVAAVTKLVLPGVSWAAAIALGAVVAPPDAVAATAVAKRAGMPRRLVTILEGESLFNDATALVTVRVAVAVAVEGTFSPADTALQFLVAALGGLLVGVVVGQVLARIRRRLTSALLTTALSLVTPFAVYLLGEELHTSGVIAVVTTGLILSHRSPAEQTPAGRLTEKNLWDTVQLLLEGGVFVLIGLQLTDIIAGVSESALDVVLLSALVLLTVLLVRPLWVFGLRYVAQVVPWSSRGKPSAGGLAVISWAGMRGVVSLAAAQTLPLDLPHRDVFLLVTMVVILGTLGLQGMTLPALIRRVGVSPPDPKLDALEVARAQQKATDAAKERIREIQHEEGLSDRLSGWLTKQLDVRAYTAWEQLGDQDGETPTRTYQRLRREIVAAERKVFIELRDSGELEDDLLRELQYRLDLEESLLPAPVERGQDEGHQAVLPSRPGRGCEHLKEAPVEIPDADPRVCQSCVEEGRDDWVHLRICLTCERVGCCDSSPARHSDAHFREEGHPVVGSAERGEHWRWCFVDERVG